MSSSPLPKQFKSITDLVLLVDTTENDNLKDFIIPDIPTVGQILYHNNDNIDYKESSKFFFDNVRRFKGSPYTINITLQFKLGLHDDGSSMNDLLLKANFIQQIGCFKFKFYIFKIVTHQCPDPFVMPALGYFQFLDCIGFRFDTDIIPKHVLKFDNAKRKYYHRTVNYHIPISISWLRDDLQELHLGQKVRLSDSRFVDLVFPKLTHLGFECYDLVTSQNWCSFVKNNKNVKKTLILRDFQCRYFLESSWLLVEKVTIIGSHTPVHFSETVKYLWQAKEIHLYGSNFMLDIHESNIKKHPIATETIYYSCNPAFPLYEINYTLELLEKLETKYSIKVVKVPFLPEHECPIRSASECFSYLTRPYKLAEFEYTW